MRSDECIDVQSYNPFPYQAVNAAAVKVPTTVATNKLTSNEVSPHHTSLRPHDITLALKPRLIT